MEVIAVIRDLVIIILGVIWIATGLIVGAIAWYSYKFVKSAPRRAEAVTTPARELLGEAKQAVGTVGEGARTAKEAITFVSEKAVLPTITVVSAVAGARRFVEALFGGVEARGSEAGK